MDEHEHGKCQDLLGSLSDYVDGILNESLCAELEQHLRSCNNCKVVVDTLRKTIELYHHIDEDEPLPENVRMRLFRRLNITDYQTK